ncbi:MAG: hypothetical protein BJ554DRAFT_930 [Olpidium bornovanus]|uniref:Uncharacterized protein n=1 Tax=Olpidium bornovanus TaxID=278681 RepID=A0A8H8A1Z3_9FUNG|nr:MAG: hypothetical protein BJ554DRAFT_930 [Olpidium bornovanus]
MFFADEFLCPKSPKKKKEKGKEKEGKKKTKSEAGRRFKKREPAVGAGFPRRTSSRPLYRKKRHVPPRANSPASKTPPPRKHAARANLIAARASDDRQRAEDPPAGCGGDGPARRAGRSGAAAGARRDLPRLQEPPLAYHKRVRVRFGRRRPSRVPILALFPEQHLDDRVIQGPPEAPPPQDAVADQSVHCGSDAGRGAQQQESVPSTAKNARGRSSAQPGAGEDHQNRGEDALHLVVAESAARQMNNRRLRPEGSVDLVRVLQIQGWGKTGERAQTGCAVSFKGTTGPSRTPPTPTGFARAPSARLTDRNMRLSSAGRVKKAAGPRSPSEKVVSDPAGGKRVSRVFVQNLFFFRTQRAGLIPPGAGLFSDETWTFFSPLQLRRAGEAEAEGAAEEARDGGREGPGEEGAVEELSAAAAAAPLPFFPSGGAPRFPAGPSAALHSRPALASPPRTGEIRAGVREAAKALEAARRGAGPFLFPRRLPFDGLLRDNKEEEATGRGMPRTARRRRLAGVPTPFAETPSSVRAARLETGGGRGAGGGRRGWREIPSELFFFFFFFFAWFRLRKSS